MTQSSNYVQRSQRICHAQLLNFCLNRFWVLFFFLCLMQLWVRKCQLFHSEVIGSLVSDGGQNLYLCSFVFLFCNGKQICPPQKTATSFIVVLNSGLPSLSQAMAAAFSWILWSPNILHNTTIYFYLDKKSKIKMVLWGLMSTVLCGLIPENSLWWITLFWQTKCFMEEAVGKAETVGRVNYHSISEGYFHIVEIL